MAEQERDDIDLGAALESEPLLRDARIAELIEEVEGLRVKAESAAVIEQAKGVIMHARRCGPEAAFAVLVAQSQHQNRKLRDVAADIANAQEQRPATS